MYHSLFICIGLLEEADAMANASTDLDNAEAQRQLNNNNRPASTGFWETETTSAKLFECSRIKALAGEQTKIHKYSKFGFCILLFIQVVVEGQVQFY